MAVWAAEVAPAEAQSDDGERIRGRIVAQRLADGRTEFGWEPTGGERVLPTGRFFPADIDHRRWLRSTPVEVDGAQIGRIYARLSADGRIEFAFTLPDGRRIEPRARYFPTDATVGVWLRSNEITFSRFKEETGITTRVARKDAIVAALFGYDDPDDADRLTYHDYNDFGCPLSRDLEPAGRKADCESWSPVPYRSTYEPGWQWIVRDESGNRVPVPGYIEGHSGWDIQTQTKGNEPFYSLTSGTVVAVDDLSDGIGQAGVIAIQVATNGPTVVYIHASAIDNRIRVDAPVQPGDCLGRQGTTGTTSGAHIHLELRNGSARGGSGGAYWLPNGRTAPQSPSVDPIDYLYQSLARSSFEPRRCQFESSSGFGDDDLIRGRSSPEVYVVKIENGKQFKRHVVAHGLYAAVPEWDERDVQTVSAAAVDDIRESPLVRLPAAAVRIHSGDTNRIYFVEETGEDAIVLRHIPDPAAFARAGCDWDGVFAMSAGEYNYWRMRIGDALDGGQTSNTFRCPQ